MINKTIAITGHSGIIGSNFLKKFKKNKYIKCNFDITVVLYNDNHNYD